MKINIRSAMYGALVLTCSNMLLQVISFVYRVFVSRLIGGEGMGLFSLIMSMYSVIMSLVVSGVAVSVSRLSAGYGALGHTRKVSQLTTRAIFAFVILFALVAAAVLPFSDFISVHLLGDARTRMGLIVLLPCIFFTGLENIHKNHFYGLKKVHQPAVSEVLEMAVRSLAVILLLTFLKPVYLEYAVALIVFGMVICEVFSAGLLRLMYRHEQKGIVPAGPAMPVKSMLRDMSAIAVPIALANLLSNLISSVNSVIIPARLIVSGLSSSEAMSTYGVMVGMTMPLLGLPTAFMVALSLVMIPRLSEDLALSRYDLMNRRVVRTLRVTALVIAPSMVLLTLFGPQLAVLLFKQEAAGAYFLPLAVGTLFACFQGIMGSLLSGIGEQKKTAANMIAAGLLQLALTWLATALPSLRIGGFVLAFGVASLTGAILCAVDLRRFFRTHAVT